VHLPVRPVFYEELDLIGFPDRGFSYPKSDEPILWAAGRNYYYYGEKIATTIGGGFFEDIKLEIFTTKRKLIPISIVDVVERNLQQILFYSHDSIDFIRSKIENFENKIDIIAVSFSGGKDSVVVADLIKRSLNSNSFTIVFADTTLESPFTYSFIEKYVHENPQLNYIKTTAKHPQVEWWNVFGPPSRIHRWCHTVYKTAPIRKKLKKVAGTENPRVLLVDGIRMEESSRRSKYDNVQFGTKNMLQTNISPILNWSSLEVFLYTFYRNLNINNLYRYGFHRVGCIICPYSASWGEYLSKRIHENELEPYINILKNNAEYAKIKDIHSYISEGGWKSRSGGMDLEIGGDRVDFKAEDNKFSIVCNNQKSEFWNWIKTLGSLVYKNNNGILHYNNDFVVITEKTNKSRIKYTLEGFKKDIKFVNLLKKIGYKCEYCIHCQACEAVCPTGALKIDDTVNIDPEKCVHCFNCINYVEKGCWVAKSITYIGFIAGKNMSGKGMSRYQGFGFEKKWLSLFKKDDAWKDEKTSSMGNCQISGFKNWLKDAGLYENNVPTELGELLAKIPNIDDLFQWGIIWNNLAENSPLIEWYAINVPEGYHSRNELMEMLAQHRGEAESNRTDKNSISSLVNTLIHSPIGEKLKQGIETKSGKDKLLRKTQCPEVPDLVVLYSIYRYSDRKGRKKLVVSEFIKNNEISPHLLFGLDLNMIKSSLTKIASKYPEFIHIEFSGNLDNINLSDDIQSLDIVKHYVNNLI